MSMPLSLTEEERAALREYGQTEKTYCHYCEELIYDRSDPESYRIGTPRDATLLRIEAGKVQVCHKRCLSSD